MATENKSMKLPDRFYCGFQQREVDDAPLGFITPWGTDKAFEKRKNTVDEWAARKHNNNASLDPVEFDNEPITGFKLGRSVRRHGWYGYGGNVVVRIEDPRGFELEISVNNLIQLMVNNTVEYGEIMAPCVWARDGGTNVLLATNSAPYLEAMDNTARSKRSVSLRDVKIGYKVRLQNGKEGQYLGKMFRIQDEEYWDGGRYYSNAPRTIKLENTAKCAMLYTDENGNVDVDFTSSIKVADIIDESTVYTLTESVALVNKMFQNGQISSWHIHGVVAEKKTIKMVFREISLDQAKKTSNAFGFARDSLWSLSHLEYAINHNNGGVHSTKIIDDGSSYRYPTRTVKMSWYGTREETINEQIDLAEFTKFYVIDFEI